MKPNTRIFHYTLLNFHDEVMISKDFEYEQVISAIARGGRLFWETESCARVLIATDDGFKATIEWGLRDKY